MKRITIVFAACIMLFSVYENASAQRLKKVRASKRIVAYDAEGNVIDSLSKSLKDQADVSRYLDEIQVQLHEIETDLNKLEGDPDKELERQILMEKKLALLDEKLETIKQIQNNKENLVKEYYIIVESFKKKKNAKKAIKQWAAKGYPAFIFNNKFRDWYYISVGRRMSYNTAIKYQFQLKKEGVDSWIYYWAGNK
jgi:hypothetical protein